MLLFALASACTEETPSDPAAITTEADPACATEANLTSAEVEFLAERFDDPDTEDQEATVDFVGLCEAAAFQLAQQLNVNAYVLTRDGEQVGDPTLSFTNVVALVVVNDAVVEAMHQ